MTERQVQEKLVMLLEKFSGAMSRAGRACAGIRELLTEHPKLEANLPEDFKDDVRDFNRMMTSTLHWTPEIGQLEPDPPSQEAKLDLLIQRLSRIMKPAWDLVTQIQVSAKASHITKAELDTLLEIHGGIDLQLQHLREEIKALTAAIKQQETGNRQ
jgi:hypothetical protein